MSCPVKVGSEFNSYEELLAAVREFEADQCVAYYKRVFNMISTQHRSTMRLNLHVWKEERSSRKSLGQRPNQRLVIIRAINGFNTIFVLYCLPIHIYFLIESTHLAISFHLNIVWYHNYFVWLIVKFIIDIFNGS